MGEETSETGMRLTHAGPFDFVGLHRFPARCHVRVWEGTGRLPVVIATELEDNPGTSITNAAELVASQVWEQLLPHAREGFVWIERYPARRDRSGRIAPDSALDGESLDLVTFALAGGRELEMREDPHPWRRVGRAEVERLVGPLPMRPDEV